MRTIPTQSNSPGVEPQGHQDQVVDLVPCASCGLRTPRRAGETVVFCPDCLDHAFLDEYSDEWDDLGGEG